jgi:hypothetical protein
VNLAHSFFPPSQLLPHNAVTPDRPDLLIHSTMQAVAQPRTLALTTRHQYTDAIPLVATNYGATGPQFESKLMLPNEDATLNAYLTHWGSAANHLLFSSRLAAAGTPPQHRLMPNQIVTMIPILRNALPATEFPDLDNYIQHLNVASPKALNTFYAVIAQLLGARNGNLATPHEWFTLPSPPTAGSTEANTADYLATVALKATAQPAAQPAAQPRDVIVIQDTTDYTPSVSELAVQAQILAKTHTALNRSSMLPPNLALASAQATLELVQTFQELVAVLPGIYEMLERQTRLVASPQFPFNVIMEAAAQEIQVVLSSYRELLQAGISCTIDPLSHLETLGRAPSLETAAKVTDTRVDRQHANRKRARGFQKQTYQSKDDFIDDLMDQEARKRNRHSPSPERYERHRNDRDRRDNRGRRNDRDDRGQRDDRDNQDRRADRNRQPDRTPTTAIGKLWSAITKKFGNKASRRDMFDLLDGRCAHCLKAINQSIKSCGDNRCKQDEVHAELTARIFATSKPSELKYK